MGAMSPQRSSDSRLVLALGLALVAGYYFLPSGGTAQAMILTLINGSAAVSALRTAAHAEQRTRIVWAALGTGLTLSTLAHMSYYGYPLPLPVPADALWLLTYPCFALALVCFAGLRQADDDAGTFGGAALLAISGGIVLWSFALAPFANLLATVAAPALDVVLFLVVLLVLSRTRGTRTAAGNLMFGGFAALLAGAVLFAVELGASGYRLGGPCDALWLLGYVLLAVAAAQPAGSLAGSEQSAPRPSAGRLAGFAPAH